MPSLKQCFDRHGCDRGNRHHYERVYGPLFNSIRHLPLRILEIGVLRGAGIWAWLDFFPKATITGLDTFQRIAPHRIEVLKHERVRYVEGDSTTVDLEGDFDLIFDDGDHRARSQLRTLQNLYPRVSPGHYFIEDVWPHKPGYDELLAVLPDDSVHHDLREVGAGDSYIIQC